uniref:Uncharacterized protein n=1 Tax=Ciona savignyi TaxID=51511 RepID=H2Y637_CIOSA
MVCIPCIVIPLFLWIYHKFIQPWVYPVISKFWTPKSIDKGTSNDAKKCPFTNGTSKEVSAGGEEVSDKKTD